ncbi:hypothetical protein AC578_6562 [Pseudocercospora eumusae]|uniref:F-box domain-containing protein n=1 Tax=Pseudocercospora eumusae TaxID=321146 RepID=A0A139HHY8_9PEZI|nr:hypothetical protein AC578_6562 [Pseudocercospora eumusae]
MTYQLLGDVDGLLEMNNPGRRARLAKRERRLAACNAVLNTPELLERILSHVEFPKKLHVGAFVGEDFPKRSANNGNTKTQKRVTIFSCRQVSKYWNSVITTSPLLKQSMWLVQPPMPVSLGQMRQEEFSKTAMAYKLQTSASLSIFAPHRSAPVTLNPVLFPHSWEWQPCKGNPRRVLGDPVYGSCACSGKWNKFNVHGYGRFQYLVNQVHCTHQPHMYGPELDVDVLEIALLPISMTGPTPKASWQKMYLSNSPKNIFLCVQFDRIFVRLSESFGRQSHEMGFC